MMGETVASTSFCFASFYRGDRSLAFDGPEVVAKTASHAAPNPTPRRSAGRRSPQPAAALEAALLAAALPGGSRTRAA
jgi:hypothetical protein